MSRQDESNPDDLIAEVKLSRTYTLVIERVWIGTERAVRLKVRHQADDKIVSFRGGFIVPARKLGNTIAALRLALEAIENLESW